MRRYDDTRVVFEAKIFIAMELGVVPTAKIIQMPKSTLHHHLRKRLPTLEPELYEKVERILLSHKGGKKK